MLAHPSVEALGHRNDVPELMRRERRAGAAEHRGGVPGWCTSEALASGCVPVVSDASGALCKHGVNALVHHVGDVDDARLSS